ncbi:hypothetical protein DMENIID0001_021890 [Sergentomyia squamirostris]
MNSLVLVIFLSVLGGGIAFLGPNLAAIFRAAQIVPNVIPEAPGRQLEVVYEGFNRVSLGEEIFPRAVRSSPTIVKCLLCGINPLAFYTLVMINPDAPRRDNPFEANWLHFLTVNVPGHRFAFGLHMGEVIAEYVGAGPADGTGFHRYIFLLYQQPNGRTLFDEPRIPANNASLRRNFALNLFVTRYRLHLVAGNFFQSTYDSSVGAWDAQFID